MSRLADTQLGRVAIVGRPNVGKSTLLNRMVGSRVAIVEPTAGVTRDRVCVQARITTADEERWIELIDTGGIGIVDRDDLSGSVEDQVQSALEWADLVLFVVDVREGLTPLDKEVGRRLRGVEVPVMLVCNKVEGESFDWDVESFRQLGMMEGPFAISAQNGERLAPLFQRMLELLPVSGSVEKPASPVLNLGVVGQRNAGKSTLINSWAGEQRMIVSEIPGTTRDAVDVRFERDGEVFVAIDTAGVRRKSKIADAIEFYSDARSYKTIRRADVTVLLFDVSRPLSAIDKRLARYVTDHYKPVILGANKWDVVAQDYERSEFVEYVRAELAGLTHAPLMFLSAKTGRGVTQLLRRARDLHEASHYRVSTGELNRVLAKATEARAPSKSGYRVKILYATQAEAAPPTFILFVNDKKLIGKDYIRYLQNRLREEFPLREVPIHIVLRDRSDRTEDH